MEANISAFQGGVRSMFNDEVPLQISEFLATARAAQENLAIRQQLLEERLSASERFVDDELKKIQSVVAHFETVLKDADAQGWRTAAESMQKEGKQQALALDNTLESIRDSLKTTSTQIDQATTQLVKGLNKTLNGLHAAELEQLVEDSAHEVKIVANTATKQLVEIGRWFYWKNIILVLFLSLIVVLFTGLFIDDEWPWESHKSAVKERVAGQALLEVWPQLSFSDQQRIMSNVA